MLVFERTGGSTYITVTLTELTTIINNPIYYLFIFTHTETQTQVKKILAAANDTSQFKYRYNRWIVNPNDLFGNAPNGEYLYEVRQQISPTDETVTDAKEIVEVGKAILKGEEFTYENYNIATSYKTYNG